MCFRTLFLCLTTSYRAVREGYRSCNHFSDYLDIVDQVQNMAAKCVGAVLASSGGSWEGRVAANLLGTVIVSVKSVKTCRHLGGLLNN